MADDLSTLFGIPNPTQAPWTDRNSPLLGGSGATPGRSFDNATPASQPMSFPAGGIGGAQIEGNPISSTGGGGQTPVDLAPSGRTPRIIDRIPDQPPRTFGGVRPIPTTFSGNVNPVGASSPGGGHTMPVGSYAMGPEDLDSVTRTMLAEAGESATPSSMAAVAHVIRNRMAKGGYGSSPYDIVHAKNQFEPWGSSDNDPNRFSTSSPAYQQAQSLAEGVFSGRVQDNTQGATHFFSPSGQAAKGRSTPSWASGDPLAQIGGHQFFAPNGGPTPEQLASVPSMSGLSTIAGGGTGNMSSMSAIGSTPGAGTGMGGLSSQQFAQLMGAAQGVGRPQVGLLGQMLFGNKGIMGLMPQSIQEHGIIGGLGSAFQGGGGGTPAPPPSGLQPSPGVSAPPSIVPQPLAPRGPGVVPIPAIAGGAGTGSPPSMASGPIQQQNGPVQPGQGNPHMPGFDPKSVPFINTPVGGSAGGAGSTQGSLGAPGMPAGGAGGGVDPQKLSMLAQLFQNGGIGAAPPVAPAIGGGGGLIGGLAGLFA